MSDYLADAREAELERDALAQAMWDVRAAFGFDTDGDDRYHTQDFGHIAESFRRDMAEALKDLRDEVSEADQDAWQRGHSAALQHRATAWAEGYHRGLRDSEQDVVHGADNPYAEDERCPT